MRSYLKPHKVQDMICNVLDGTNHEAQKPATSQCPTCKTCTTGTFRSIFGNTCGGQR